MAVKTRAELTAELQTLFPDNNQGFITPTILRTQQTDVIDSYVISTSATLTNNVLVRGASGQDIDLIESGGASVSANNDANQLIITPDTDELAALILRDSGSVEQFTVGFSDLFGNANLASNPAMVIESVDSSITINTTTLPTLIQRLGMDDADIVLTLNNTGTNGVEIDLFTTDQDPVGNIIGDSGAVALRGGVTPKAYIHTDSTTNVTGWSEIAFVPAGGSIVTTTDTLTDNVMIVGDGAAAVGVAENASSSIAASSLANELIITGGGSVDSILQLILDGGQAWSLGIDRGDSSKLKIGSDPVVGVDDHLVIVANDGWVGIGTSSPTCRMDINHDSLETRARIRSASNDPVLEFQSSAQSFTVGVDQSDNSKFIICSDASLGTDICLAIDRATDFVGIGTSSPAHRLHVNSTTGEGRTEISSGDDDAVLQLSTTGVQDWVVGVDRSNGSKFQICEGSVLGTNDRITIDPFTNAVLIGSDSPSFGSPILEVGRSTGDSDIVINSFDGDPILGLVAFGGAAYYMAVDRSDSSKLKIGDGTTVGTNVTMTIISANQVGIGTESPTHTLHVADGVSGGTDVLSTLQIEDNSNVYMGLSSPNNFERGFLFGDEIAAIQGALIFNNNNVLNGFLWRTGGNTDRMALDSVGRLAIGNNSPTAQLDVDSNVAAATRAILALESAVGRSETWVTDADPNAAITGSGGDVAVRVDADTSATYESKELTTGTGWFTRSVNPTTIIEINTQAEFDALASGGIITISGNLTLLIKTGLVTANRFVINASARLFIEGSAGPSHDAIIYVGSDNFFTVNPGPVGGLGTRLSTRDMNFLGTPAGTFIDMEGGSADICQIQQAIIAGFKLGSIKRASIHQNGPTLFLENSIILDYAASLTLTDMLATTISSTNVGPFMAVPVATPLIVYTRLTIPPFAVDLLISKMNGLLTPGQSLLRVDASIDDPFGVLITEYTVTGGAVFDTSGTAPTAFTAVADNSIGATAISSVTDSSGVAQFNHAGTTPPLGSIVTISGFVTNTAYNATGRVTGSAASSFEVDFIAFGTDEASGSYLVTAVTLTSTAHGLANDTGVTIDGTVSYDGGYVIYNVQTNTFDIAATFVATESGTWSTEGLDQTTPPVLAFTSPDIPMSNYIATAFVNNNATATGAIVNNTFTDMVFGTGGSALAAASTIERWRLNDEVNGTFEYIGNETFDGYITFDFTVASSGGIVDFRFKWEIDTGSGFVDLPDAVEALVAVGSDSLSVTKTFPLEASKGDLIKPQITRNSGTSGITSTYATIYATQ